MLGDSLTQLNGVMSKLISFLSLLPLSGTWADWALYDQEDWFDLNAHLRIVGAASSGDVGGLATHGHDPTGDFTAQGFELEPTLRLNDHILLAAGINNVRTSDGEFEAELEEAYGSLSNLPGGFEVRGGRFFNRLGLQNRKHLHAWDFVDAGLTTSVFLGDENLATDGGELNWVGRYGGFTTGLTASFGEAVVESGEEEEEEAGSEEGNFAGETFTARWLLRYDVNDFHRHEFGLNLGRGRNGYGEDSEFYSADYRYLWRENGLELGGQFVELGAEFFVRSVDFVDEDLGTTGSSDHFGLSTYARYGIDAWDFGVRFDYLEGEEGDAGGDTLFAVEERFRVSLAATYNWEISDELAGHVRLQGNLDDLDDGNEQSVFLQLGFDFGGNDGL